jgi:hypothetical protein
MTNRIPLIVDTADGNKIKELPSGDALNLVGSAIVDATSISTTGTVTSSVINTASINVNGSPIAAVALSGNFDDLDNVPVGFSGDYDDLTNKPTIPIHLESLFNVGNITPTDGQGLKWSSINNQWEPGSVVADIDLSVRNIQELQNVIVTGPVDNKFLKYYAGAWRASTVTYSEVQNAPTALSQLINDVGYITVPGSAQTLSVTGGELSISDGNTVDIAQTISYDGTSLALSDSNTIETNTLDVNFRKVNTTAGVVGDVTGSLFADDSTLLVDGINGTIPSPTIEGEMQWLGAGNDDLTKIYASQGRIVAENLGTRALNLRAFNPLSSLWSDNGVSLSVNIDQSVFTQSRQLRIKDEGAGQGLQSVTILGSKYTIGANTENWTKLYLGGLSDAPEQIGGVIPDEKSHIYRFAKGWFETIDTDALIINADIELKGNLVSDDSTLLIDGATGTIPGYVSLATLKTEVAAATDFADFQTRIAAL